MHKRARRGERAPGDGSLKFCGSCQCPTLDATYCLPLSCEKHIFCGECLYDYDKRGRDVERLDVVHCLWCQRDTHLILPNLPAEEVTAGELRRSHNPNMTKIRLDRVLAMLYLESHSESDTLTLPVGPTEYAELVPIFPSLLAAGYHVQLCRPKRRIDKELPKTITEKTGLDITWEVWDDSE